jgi:hypothetical protein
MAKARTATPWYETFRVTGRKHGRREERQARAALKRLISASNDDGEAVGLQLFGQSMSPGVYARFQPIANQNLRRRRIIQTLPDGRGQTVVIVWGLEAGSEVVPTLSTRDFPDLLGTTVAVHCAGDAPDGPAFVSGVVTWLEVNSHEAPLWRPAPPLLQRWRSDGSKVTEVVDFGLSYPLPALDIVAA